MQRMAAWDEYLSASPEVGRKVQATPSLPPSRIELEEQRE